MFADLREAMSARSRLAPLAIALILGSPMSARAMDEFVRASSNGPTQLKLCGKDGAAGDAACKVQPLDALAGKMDEALQAALAKAPPKAKPLLKRDQAWFNEMAINIAQMMPASNQDSVATTLAALVKQRTEALSTIAPGFGRPGFVGRWVSAFGSVAVTPADGGAYRLAIDTHSDYHAEANDEAVWDCHFTAVLSPAGDGWLKGVIPAPDPLKTAPLKMRRQGDTLRLIVDSSAFNADFVCRRPYQVTASYFASGTSDSVAADKADTSFVAPSIDCTHPDTATDEELCADPELAANDVRLNKAWKALQPRLDDSTRRALAEDQRNWVKTQIWQYPEHLHPAWDKRTYFMHDTTDGREQLRLLQRERLALLEGFDEGRQGFGGLWLGYTAILKVSSEGDNVKAEGWKWTQGAWKDGCDFDMNGSIKNGTFRSGEKRINPDTLERDHASLIVNRLDDVFARKRFDDKGADEGKCHRSNSWSSTTRLFPVHPSPDIDAAQNTFR